MQTAEQIESQLKAIEDHISALECKPFGVSIREEMAAFYRARFQLTQKLYELRPYGVFEFGDEYLVSERGDFALDEDGEFLKFPTRADAENYISGMFGEYAA